MQLQNNNIVLQCFRRHLQQRHGKGGRLGYTVRERKPVVSPETGGRADRQQRRVRQYQLHGRPNHGEHDLRRTREGRQRLLSGRQWRPADEAHGQQTVRDHRYAYYDKLYSFEDSYDRYSRLAKLNDSF